MSEISIANVKNPLPRLIHQVEAGQPVNITHRGRPVAVLLSETDYERLSAAQSRAAPWDTTRQWRADCADDLPDLNPDEVRAWRDQGPGREFTWED